MADNSLVHSHSGWLHSKVETTVHAGFGSWWVCFFIPASAPLAPFIPEPAESKAGLSAVKWKVADFDPSDSPDDVEFDSFSPQVFWLFSLCLSLLSLFLFDFLSTFWLAIEGVLDYMKGMLSNTPHSPQGLEVQRFLHCRAWVLAQHNNP